MGIARAQHATTPLPLMTLQPAGTLFLAQRGDIEHKKHTFFTQIQEQLQMLQTAVAAVGLFA